MYLLEVEDFSVRFHRYGRGLEQRDIEVIRDIHVSVKEREFVAVAGASGSGKSLLAHSILGILPSNARVSGAIRYCGEPLTPGLQKKLRGQALALVPQSVGFLDPLMRVGKQVIGVRGSEAKRRELFSRYGLPETTAELFPFQLSGGMARRVLVSTAVIGNARLIIADEPTPGMTVDMARTAMGHFRELADEGAGVLLITHDLDLAFEYADRIAVFYAGTTLEVAPAEDFKRGTSALRHPYSKALWQAIPQNGFLPIPGTQPYGAELAQACLYSPRCSQRTGACDQKIPMRELRGGEVRCIHAV